MIKHNFSENSILLVCATDVERDAMFSLTHQAMSFEYENNLYYDLGRIGRSHVYLVQCNMGTSTPGGSSSVVKSALHAIKPVCVIMHGIAFGIDSSKHPIGTVLVADWYRAYECARIGQTSDGAIQISPRGEKMPSDPFLKSVLKDVAIHFSGKSAFGGILSGPILVDNSEFKKLLLSFEAEAIGGEMEIKGMALAAYEAHIPWIAAKAVCDYADGNKNVNKKQNQAVAATASAQFVFAAIISDLLVPHKIKQQNRSETSQSSITVKVNKVIESKEDVLIANTIGHPPVNEGKQTIEVTSPIIKAGKNVVIGNNYNKTGNDDGN